MSKEGEAKSRKDRLLGSSSYDLMIDTVCRKGEAGGLLGLLEAMKKRGYGISKQSFSKVSKRFKSEGMERELGSLNAMYCLSSVKDVSGRICKILKKEEEPEAIRQALQELGVTPCADSIVDVLDRVGTFPKRAMVFYQWVEKIPFLEIDGKIYNAMARVLGREDCINDFWVLLRKMRSCGVGLEMETYFMVSNRFLKRRMVSVALDLYEFAMASTKKPPVDEFLILFKKVIVSKDLDMSLVTKIVKIFTGAGNSIKVSAFDGVIKSLRSVSRLGECDKILKAMEEGGYKCDGDMIHDRVVVALCDAGKSDEAVKYVVDLEKLGWDLDLKSWSSIVQKHTLVGQLDNAISCFHMMVERKGGENVGSALELLLNGLCSKKGALYACQVLKDLVANRKVQPWHTTYKFLIEKLIGQGHVKEASSLLGLMKSHGFPPFINPFIKYVSKSGTADDAGLFLKAMTVKDFPSRAVYVRIFEALFKAGRHDVAHDVLSLAPGCVRNHADVLDLLYSMKPNEAAIAAA